MNEPQETRCGKSSIDGGGGIGGGINFIGADGAVLDKLPSGMEAVMDPDAICSLDYSLASLTSLSPPPGEGQGQQDGGGSWQPRSSKSDDGPPPTATATAGTTGAAIARTTTAAAAAAGPKQARAEAGRASSEKIASSGPNRHNRGSRDRDDDTTGRSGGVEAGETSGRGAAEYGHPSMAAKARGGKKRRKRGDDAGDGDGDGDRDDPDFDGGGGKTAGGEVEDAKENPKQRANRVRNREHARNTRIRKKQYVESLKLQVGEMLQAKAQEERDAQLETSNMSAKRTAMRQMVLNILYLKATEELSPRSWACVLDDGFTCVYPITPFRSFPPSEAQEDHRLITGIEGMIQDTASLAVFIKSICPRSRNPTGRKGFL
ncbi:conserved unknown protein [Ectocarpus siliculosus]|uniref:BZIP domain-containing protein n=1 Tax=Ectocarpus siliculosus TaxID=2880 RepID=D7G943_ECTSI|nr:conserved unknown protein [Ectocarpus siliculosus]|eukprot:CBJ34076.1 conserved unknown protein [Ectocarpus siliculosus]